MRKGAKLRGITKSCMAKSFSGEADRNIGDKKSFRNLKPRHFHLRGLARFGAVYRGLARSIEISKFDTETRIARIDSNGEGDRRERAQRATKMRAENRCRNWCRNGAKTG